MIAAFSNREIGHPVFASVAAVSNTSWLDLDFAESLAIGVGEQALLV
ncbi:MAG: hypothetical protein ACREYF_04460 [Gammaproteobacteria bacterium]